MAATKRIPTEIEFEGKKFDLYTDNDGWPQFDLYHLKSKPNELQFEVDDECKVIIYTCKLPTGKFGCGYEIDRRITVAENDLNGKCIGTGPGGSKSFETEFEAQLFIVKEVMNNRVLSSFSSYLGGLMRKELRKFINPVSLF
jgi:hypothetical protein